MPEKPSASHAAGIELCNNVIRFAILSLDSKQVKLESLLEIPVEIHQQESGLHVKPLYKGNQKQLVESIIEQNLLVSSILTSQVLVRPLEVKLKKESDIDDVLSFQAEPIIPYPLNKAILDRVIIESTKEGSQLSVFITRDDYLTTHIDFWKSAGIDPEMVSCVPQAMTAFAGKFDNKTLYAIHISDNETSCALIRNEKLIATKSIPKGSHELNEALKQDLPTNTTVSLEKINFYNITPESHPNLSKGVQLLTTEITRLIYSYAKALKAVEINEVLITGEGAEWEGFDQSIAKGIGKVLIDPEPRPKIDLSLTKQKQFAIPIGAAITALNHQTDQINFRQGAFAYPNPWKRMKKPMISFLGLSLLLAFAIYLFGGAYAGYRRDKVREEYANLLGSLKKPYAQFESEFNTKIKKSSDKEGGPVKPLLELSEQDIQERLAFISKELNESPDIFPLFPNVPRVSDVLGWLSNHEIILGLKEGENTLNPSIKLNKFNYKLVKRPDKNKKNERYQVAVDLELITASPVAARDFHEALLQPNPIVDPKSEVKWSSSRGVYKTSFMLKDKTTYPPIKGP